MRWVAVTGVWTGAMVLWALSYLGYSDFRGLGVVYPIGLWLVGMVVILVAGLASWVWRRRHGQNDALTSDEPPPP